MRRQLAFLPVYIVMGYLWGAQVVNFWTPGLVARNERLKGGDFLHFYTLGAIVRSGDSRPLYDIEQLNSVADRLVPEAKGIRYLPAWGPQVALLFAPFAALSYGWALTAWSALTLIVYAICGRAIWRRTPALSRDGPLVALLAALSPALFNLISYGQTSILAFGALTLAYVAFHAQRPLLAGAAIGLLAYKPQLGLAAAIVFLVCREWRVVAGAIATAVAQLAFAWVTAGTAVMKAYLDTVINLPRQAAVFEPFPHEAHSLHGFFRLLLPAPAVGPAAIAAAVPVLIAAILVWRSRAPLPLRFMSLMLATVLVSPHLLSYDLVLPLIPLLPLWGWLRTQERRPPIKAAAVFAYFVYFSPAILIAKLVHVQPTTMSMLLLLATLTWLARRQAWTAA